LTPGQRRDSPDNDGPGDACDADRDGDETDLVASEASQPLSGEIYHYLVRVENGCGANLGSDSSDTPVLAASVPEEQKRGTDLFFEKINLSPFCG